MTTAANYARCKGAAALINPATLALTGWYRGTWAVPWPGTASAGSSGSHSLTTHFGQDPVAGLTLNGFQAANFAGTHTLLDAIFYASGYISRTAYRVHMLVYVAATIASTGIVNDPYLVSDSSATWAVALTNTGIQVAHSGVQVAASAGTLSTGAWHDVDVLFDGAHVTVTVDGVAGTPGASTDVGAGIVSSPLYVAYNANSGVHANVQIMDLMLASASLSGTTAGAFKGYVNNRYGLSL